MTDTVLCPLACCLQPPVQAALPPALLPLRGCTQSSPLSAPVDRYWVLFWCLHLSPAFLPSRSAPTAVCWGCLGTLVQALNCVQLFATPQTAACQASPSFTISQSLLKLVSIALAMPSNHLIVPFSCLQSFPTSGSFPMSWLFASGGQSIGASASVLPLNIQD